MSVKIGGRLTFSRLNDDIAQNTEFLTTGVKTTNPTIDVLENNGNSTETVTSVYIYIYIYIYI
jgi:hypothetical protein